SLGQHRKPWTASAAQNLQGGRETQSGGNMLRRLPALPLVALFTALSFAPAAQGGSLDLQFGIIDPNAVQGDVFGGAGAISLSGGKALIGAKGDATTGATSGRAYV